VRSGVPGHLRDTTGPCVVRARGRGPRESSGFEGERDRVPDRAARIAIDRRAAPRYPVRTPAGAFAPENSADPCFDLAGACYCWGAGRAAGGCTTALVRAMGRPAAPTARASTPPTLDPSTPRSTRTGRPPTGSTRPKRPWTPRPTPLATAFHRTRRPTARLPW